MYEAVIKTMHKKKKYKKAKWLSEEALQIAEKRREAKVEWFYGDLQDLLELTAKKDVLFIIGDWNANLRSQEIPAIAGKFGLGVQHKAGQRLTKLCQENARSLQTLSLTTQEMTLHMDITIGQYWSRLIIFFAAKDGEALYSQQKQDLN